MDCSDLLADLCEAFHTHLLQLCEGRIYEDAVAYKQLACALNNGCCGT